jgi:DNA transformation protein
MEADVIRELFAAFGPVTPRRMFGSYGVFADGIMFALVSGGVIYLKADERTVDDFSAAGSRPFTYQRMGSTATLTSYWRLPERLYDDADELADWAQRALEVARRTALRPRAAERTRLKPPAARRAGRIPDRSRR